MHTEYRRSPGADEFSRCWRLYKAGAVTLDDFVGQRHSKDWGTTRQAKSLSSILGSDAAKKWATQSFLARVDANVPKSIGAMASDKAVREGLRLSQLETTPKEKIRAILQTLENTNELPLLTRHFSKHGPEFRDIGVTSESQYLDAFQKHSHRDNLRFFTYIRRKRAELMWQSVDVDNGTVALYNESRGVYWSFFRHANVDAFLGSGRTLWVEVLRPSLEFEKW
jgi:hypothetical protein